MISVIIPYIRPKGYKRCVESIKKHTKDIEYEIVAEEDWQRIGCPMMVNRLVSRTKYNYVFFAADDIVFKNNALYIAFKKMLEFPDGWGLVTINDKPLAGLLTAHWLAHKKLLQFLDGEFFHSGYVHNFCDMELVKRASNINRYKQAEDALVDHINPVRKNKIELVDEDYKRIAKYFNRDQYLYEMRVRNNPQWE